MYVKKQLCHHSITMTIDTCDHWIPGERKVELDRLRGGRTYSALRQGLAHVGRKMQNRMLTRFRGPSTCGFSEFAPNRLV
jgi:hypothetical protein